MPMMRRGPLDRYPTEWVLRQASAHQVSGSIEFHTDHPVTVFLQGGRVYAAVDGVGPAAGDTGAEVTASDETAIRQATIAILSRALTCEGGWYYHDPLGQHPAQGSWEWEMATLLMEIRSRAHEDHTLADWAARSIELKETPASSITLGPDAWAVVVSMLETTTANEIRARLGWNPSRLVAALTEIEQRGVLDPEPAWRPRVIEAPSENPPAMPSPPSPAAPAESLPARHRGPLTPPPTFATPSPAAGADGGRRRRLPGRRSST